MCRQVSCRRCGGVTWAGCGLHVDQVMRGVPAKARCDCPQEPGRGSGPGLLARIFGRQS